jgi:hypothetical protein
MFLSRSAVAAATARGRILAGKDRWIRTLARPSSRVVSAAALVPGAAVSAAFQFPQFAVPPQKFAWNQQQSFHATTRTEAKLNVQQLAEKVNLKGVNVLVRVDLNVPLAKVCTLTGNIVCKQAYLF